MIHELKKVYLWRSERVLIGELETKLEQLPVVTGPGCSTKIDDPPAGGDHVEMVETLHVALPCGFSARTYLLHDILFLIGIQSDAGRRICLHHSKLSQQFLLQGIKHALD